MFKQKKITRQTGNGGTEDVEIMVPLKTFGEHFCEINLQLKWSRKCIIVAGTANNQNPTFQINDTYVSDATL